MPQKNRPDNWIIYLYFTLVLAGLLAVYSAGYYIGIRFTGNPYYFSIRQLIWSILSVGIFFFFSHQDYHILKKWIKPMTFLTLLLLFMVFIPGLNKTGGGATRWINFRLFTFNPSEFSKLTIIIYLSHILTKKSAKLKDFISGILPPLILVAVLFFIILLQSGFSTSAILLGVSFILFFVGGASIKHLVSAGIFSLPLLTFFIVNVGYRKARILSFLNPWTDASGRGYHIIQSLKGFASGGLFGRGLGNSLQKIHKLPTPHTDFILSVIAEETGLLGTMILLILFLILFIRGLQISLQCSDKFGQLLSFGIVLLITIHALLNFGINIGILPPTGVSLPFLSYGGSSMLIFSVAMGILTNISSQTGNPSLSLKEVEEIIESGI